MSGPLAGDYNNQMMRWLGYGVMSVSLAAAVILRGGVIVAEWQGYAIGLSLGSLIWAALGPKNERAPVQRGLLVALALLLAWFFFQMIPLPPVVVAWLSPQRWNAVSSARGLLHQDLTAWTALSVAPSATLERLIFVLPAMAVFVAAREMGWWWKERLWIPIAPVVAVAWLESLLGLTQFYFARIAGGLAASSRGTYVNRNHFAGLLELAFPVTLMWAIATWRRNTTRDEQPFGASIATAGLLAVAASLLVGIVLSLSRMGFLSTLAAVGITLLMFLASLGSAHSRWSRWRWAVPAIVLVFIVIALPTQEMLSRFADMAATEDITQDTRAGIWKDSLHLVGDYPWSGCGLGTFEQCLYRYKTVAPVNSVDFAHNDYLQMLVELGPLASVLSAALAAFALWMPLSVVVSGRGRPNWEMAIGLFGSLLVIGLHSLTDFNLYIPANAVAFAWLAGIAVSPGLRT